MNNRNSLNTLRFMAASQVLLVHAFNHLDVITPNYIKPVLFLFPGVAIFFVLSGYLIWQSLEKSSSYSVYLKKRVFRIYPELWGGVFIEVIVIMLFGKTLIKLTDMLLFVVSQGSIFQFWTPDSLRWFGCGTPNGALWTISMIIQFYIVVYFLYKILNRRSIKIWILFFSFTIICAIGVTLSSDYLPMIISKLLSVSLFRYLWMFVIGMFLAEYRKKISPVINKRWYVFLGIAVLYKFFNLKLVLPNDYYDIILTILLSYGWIGFAYAVPKLNIKTDISYGMYIYHMIIINIMIELGFIGEMKYIIWTFIISCTCAYISSVSLGRISKQMKGKLLNEKRF